jgi:hypothetical protein
MTMSSAAKQLLIDLNFIHLSTGICSDSPEKWLDTLAPPFWRFWHDHESRTIHNFRPFCAQAFCGPETCGAT